MVDQLTGVATSRSFDASQFIRDKRRCSVEEHPMAE